MLLKIIELISESKKGCCFAIEGGWGVGKTFVIEKVEEHLRKIQSEKTGSDRYFIFHYNCWQYDYYDEPSVAIISAMTASIKKDNSIISENVDNTIKAAYELAIKKLGEVAGAFIENKIGINLFCLADAIKEKKEDSESESYEFNRIFNFSQTIEKARKNLQEIAEERTIVLVVDELDRCIPEYAIKVLERLHHIFYGLENVVVVMAIDRKQLEHSVEEMFGAKNDGSMDIDRYLKKFIDFSMVLDNGKINEFMHEKYAFYFHRFVENRPSDNENMNTILIMLFSETDIRRQIKIIEKANLVHSLICDEKASVSVLAFEIFYETAKIWGLECIDCILEFNEWRKDGIVNIEERKLSILNKIVEKAYVEHKQSVPPSKILVNDNLYGDIYYFVWRILGKNIGNHMLKNERNTQRLDKDLEIARKYYEFCEIVK